MKEAKDDVEICRKAAEMGDKKAQFELGLYYERVAGHVPESVKSYTEDENERFGREEFDFNLTDEHLEEMAENTEKAKEFYRLSAAQDFGPAQYRLGILLQSEAAKLFQAAADDGHAGAAKKLAMCYLSGAGVRQDPVSAHDYLERASASREIEMSICRCLDMSLYNEVYSTLQIGDKK